MNSRFGTTHAVHVRLKVLSPAVLRNMTARNGDDLDGADKGREGYEVDEKVTRRRRARRMLDCIFLGIRSVDVSIPIGDVYK